MCVFAGGSILKLNEYDLQTYSNKNLIAINQDPTGRQAKLVMQYTQKTPNPYDPSVQQVWLKGPLENGAETFPLVFFARHFTYTQNICQDRLGTNIRKVETKTTFLQAITRLLSSTPPTQAKTMSRPNTPSCNR